MPFLFVEKGILCIINAKIAQFMSGGAIDAKTKNLCIRCSFNL